MLYPLGSLPRLCLLCFFWVAFMAFIVFPIAFALLQGFGLRGCPWQGQRKLQVSTLSFWKLQISKKNSTNHFYPENCHPSYDIIWCNMMAPPIIWWPQPIIWWPKPIIWWPKPIIWWPHPSNDIIWCNMMDPLFVVILEPVPNWFDLKKQCRPFQNFGFHFELFFWVMTGLLIFSIYVSFSNQWAIHAQAPQQPLFSQLLTVQEVAQSPFGTFSKNRSPYPRLALPQGFGPSSRL